MTDYEKIIHAVTQIRKQEQEPDKVYLFVNDEDYKQLKSFNFFGFKNVKIHNNIK